MRVYYDKIYSTFQNIGSTIYYYKSWIQIVKSGQDVTIHDFDGPRDKQGDPITEEITIESLVKRLHDERFPFGHGGIVGSMLLEMNIHN